MYDLRKKCPKKIKTDDFWYDPQYIKILSHRRQLGTVIGVKKRSSTMKSSTMKPSIVKSSRVLRTLLPRNEKQAYTIPPPQRFFVSSELLCHEKLGRHCVSRLNRQKDTSIMKVYRSMWETAALVTPDLFTFTPGKKVEKFLIYGGKIHHSYFKTECKDNVENVNSDTEIACIEDTIESMSLEEFLNSFGDY